jgi:hypothetical protein
MALVSSDATSLSFVLLLPDPIVHVAAPQKATKG